MKSSHSLLPHRYVSVLLILIICLSFVQLKPTQAAIMTPYYVDNTDDNKTNNAGCSTPADTDTCSLRAAIQLVNDAPGTSPYTIYVPEGIYNLMNPGSDDANSQGDLDIASGHSLTIDGAGIYLTTIYGFINEDRIIDHQGEGTLTLKELTIQHGILSTGMGGGGGIRSLSTGELTLNNVRVTDNTVEGIAATDTGGGVFVSGADMSIMGNTQIDDNSACHGGGIMVNNGSIHTVNIIETEITENTARCDIGGGILIASQATVDISQTFIHRNHAVRGAGYAQSSSTTSIISDTVVDSNVIDSDGTGPAGLEIYGTAYLSDIYITNNNAPNGIGGIRLNSGSTFTMTDSVIFNNHGFFAGGLYVEDNPSAILQRVEITLNTSTNGGGISVVNSGNLDLENATLAGNTASQSGGGLYLHTNDSTILDHVTIAGNTGASHGDAVYIGNNGRWSTRNSIISYHIDGDVCYYAGLYIRGSSGHNIFSDTTCALSHPTDLVDVDPLLGDLVSYHSYLWTMPPLPGSPAIDGAIEDDPILTDQRGVPRLDGNADGIIKSDIGAHEADAHFFLPVLMKP